MAYNSNLKHKVLNSAFGGIKDFMNKITSYDGSPNGALTATFQGQLCWDYTNDYIYINTYTSTTTWLRID